MSDIYVNADGLSKSLLQSARDTVNNAMGHAIAYDYDIFSYETCSELVQAHDQLRAIQGKLDSYMSILNSAPEELVAIDTKQKGKQTTWWQRTKYQARQVISNIIGGGNIVSVGSSLAGAAFLLSWLFGSNRSVVGGESEIDSEEETESETNTEETPEEKYGEMVDQYDWSKTDTTREAAIAVAAAAVANGQDPEQAVKEYYDDHTLINEKYVSKDELEKIGWKNIPDDQVTSLNETLEKYGITDQAEIRYFLAMCFSESGTGILEDISDAQASGYSGGSKYKGAGYLQLTGDFNYEAFAEYVGDPEIVNQGAVYVSANYAWESAAWYWKYAWGNNWATKIVNSTSSQGYQETIQALENKINPGAGSKPVQRAKEAYERAGG